MNFNKLEFEKWFTDNVDLIYKLTGIAHYNASNTGLLKFIFIQDQRIKKLEDKVSKKRNTKVTKNG